MDPHVFDTTFSFEKDTANNALVIKQEQFIPDEHIAALKLERADSLHTPAGEFHRVAHIPTGVGNKLIAMGIDIYRAPIRDILKALRQLQLDAFITSNKVS